jgi:ribosomal protein S18 acetylase RimI-like enzyme
MLQNNSMSDSPTFVIRLAAENDEPFLWEMLYQAIYIPAGCEPLPKQIIYEATLSKYVADWGQSDDLGFIAIDAGSQQPIGAVWARLFSDENKGYGYVDDATPELSIAIVPEWRGRGVGTALLKALIETAQLRYPALSLSVSTDNPARSLYERLGFDIQSASENSLTMQKRFDG